MTNRQTLSYLQSRFQSAGIQPQTKYGQNFLVDLNLVKLIAKTAELSTRDVVLEVGTGMGSLTTLLAAEAGHVVTVEIDPLLAPLAEQEFADVPNVTFLRQDALRRKNQLDPTLIQTVAEKVAEIPGGRLKLVSNLPYNVATPILSNLLDIEPWPTRMVATIQKELAERITAKPSTKDYSALSVWMQSQCKTEIVRVMAPTVFWPQPKVESAILDIQPQKILRRRIRNPDFFHDLVRKIFLHRRKFLRSALVSAVKPELGKADVDEVMESMQFGSNTRAEELTPQQLLDLSDEVLDRVKKVQTEDS
jgi:16S rRNA (adenine1518-N6/adenine1519-N6)-dimethyltransferase